MQARHGQVAAPKPKPRPKPNAAPAAPVPPPASGARTRRRRSNLLNRLYRRIAYWRSRAQHFKTQAAQLRAQLDNTRYEKVGKWGRVKPEQWKRLVLSLHGGYRLAIKTNQGYGGVAHTCKVLDVHASRMAACIWERRIALSFHLMARTWHFAHVAYARWLQSCLELSRGPCLTFEIHSVAADATNTPAAQSYKAWQSGKLGRTTHVGPRKRPRLYEPELPLLCFTSF